MKDKLGGFKMEQGQSVKRIRKKPPACFGMNDFDHFYGEVLGKEEVERVSFKSVKNVLTRADKLAVLGSQYFINRDNVLFEFNKNTEIGSV